MDVKTPLRLKLKLGNSGASPDSSEAVPTKLERKFDAMEGESQEVKEDWMSNQPREDPQNAEEPGEEFGWGQDDSSRDRHKKSKKKKKKKEKDRSRHKHKHSKDRLDVSEEPPCKKLHPDPSQGLVLSALKELMENLLDSLQKKDPQQFFKLPVTDAIAPGYSSIIKSPMDFSQMINKVQENQYESLVTFKNDFELICTNCMEYNQEDTIYHKAAKKLLYSGQKVLVPERVVALKRLIPNIMQIPTQMLGFDIVQMSLLVQETDSTVDNAKLSDVESNADICKDEMSSSEILNQAQASAAEAAEKLTQKKPSSALGFLRQRKDGTTSLNFLTGCEGNNKNCKEKPLSLGQLTGKLSQGTSALSNFKEDKRSMAKPVRPLFYGAFSSFCPAYDSTFANISKEESEMVHATYGNETAVQYADSICDFSQDCDMAMQLVDQLLNLLTHDQHSRTKAVLEERRRVQSTTTPTKEDAVQPALQTADNSPTFTDLHKLTELGIDMSFLQTFEKMEKEQKQMDKKLTSTAALIQSLSKEQTDRLSTPLPQNLNNLPAPSSHELKLAEQVCDGLASVVRDVPPGVLAPVPLVRRALGITMKPVKSDAAELVDVDVECTSLHTERMTQQKQDTNYEMQDINKCGNNFAISYIGADSVNMDVN